MICLLFQAIMGLGRYQRCHSLQDSNVSINQWSVALFSVVIGVRSFLVFDFYVVRHDSCKWHLHLIHATPSLAMHDFVQCSSFSFCVFPWLL